MSEYLKLATGAGDQYLAALAEVQENFLKAATALPAWTFATFPMTATAMLMVSELPTPRQILETNFAFTEKWLKQQRGFAEKLVGMATPAKD